MSPNVLPREFYCQDTIEVAKALLGKVVVHNSIAGKISGRIVETEAYLHDDPACHASRGMTPRNRIMFGEAGHAYIYFIYGVYYCLNCVTGPRGVAEAVLIRALQPLTGIDLMMRNRSRINETDLCSGPGKLTQALNIGPELNGEDLTSDILYIFDDNTEIGKIIACPRIGIREAKDKPWRFYPENYKKWVSVTVRSS